MQTKSTRFCPCSLAVKQISRQPLVQKVPHYLKNIMELSFWINDQDTAVTELKDFGGNAIGFCTFPTYLIFILFFWSYRKKPYLNYSILEESARSTHHQILFTVCLRTNSCLLKCFSGRHRARERRKLRDLGNGFNMQNY